MFILTQDFLSNLKNQKEDGSFKLEDIMNAISESKEDITKYCPFTCDCNKCKRKDICKLYSLSYE